MAVLLNWRLDFEGVLGKCLPCKGSRDPKSLTTQNNSELLVCLKSNVACDSPNRPSGLSKHCQRCRLKCRHALDGTTTAAPVEQSNTRQNESLVAWLTDRQRTAHWGDLIGYHTQVLTQRVINRTRAFLRGIKTPWCQPYARGFWFGGWGAVQYSNWTFQWISVNWIRVFWPEIDFSSPPTFRDRPLPHTHAYTHARVHTHAIGSNGHNDPQHERNIIK